MSDPKKISLCVFVICFSLPLSLFIKFLGESRCALISAETGMIYAVFLIASLCIFGISVVAPRAGVFIAGTVVFLYAYELTPLFETAFAYYPKWVGFTVGGFLAAVVGCFLQKKKASDWLFFAVGAACVLLLTTTEASLKNKNNSNVLYEQKGLDKKQELNPVLVLILDEHLGIGSMPVNNEGAIVARKAAMDFYERYGFLCFLNAYSRFYQTNLSLSNAFNFDRKPVPFYVEGAVNGFNVEEVRLALNRFFDFYREKGYVFRVYQNRWLNFCPPGYANVEYCMQYVNGLDELHALDLKLSDKSLLLTGNFLSAIRSGRPILQIVTELCSNYLTGDRDVIPVIEADYHDVGPIRIISAVKQLKQDMAPLQNGTVYFAHLLTPHGAFVYDERNHMKKDPKRWGWQLGGKYEYNVLYDLYYRQFRGMYVWLNEWFEQLSAQENFERLEIIMMGDHGSRIAHALPKQESITEDPRWESIARDCYATLFAIRGPLIEEGTVDYIKPIDRLLFETLFAPDRLREDTVKNNYVFTANMKPVSYGDWENASKTAADTEETQSTPAERIPGNGAER